MPEIKSIAIMITDRCNHKCYHCFRYKKNISGDINIGKLNMLAEKVKNTSVQKIRLTGGEPFLIKHLCDLIANFHKVGLYTSIITNGSLVKKTVLEKLNSNGLDALWFSVHSSVSETHNFLVGAPGSFQLLQRAIKASIESGLETNIHYPVGRQNMHDIESTLNWLDNIKVNRIKIIRLTPLGKASESNSFKHFSLNEWNDVMRQAVNNLSLNRSALEVQGVLPDEKVYRNSKTSCSILPLEYLNIDPLGYIYPCCILNGRPDFRIGHIDELFKDEWKTTVLTLEKRTIKKYKKYHDGSLPCADAKSGITNERRCPLSSGAVINEKEYSLAFSAD